jgi:glycosyltransferase involved in cell wall biosynthesis
MQFQYSTADVNGQERPSEITDCPLHIGFVMSTELGLKTQYLNWRHGLKEPGVDPQWIVIDWWQPYGLFLPFGRAVHSLIARFYAQRDIRQGLACGPFDALFLAGHMLHAVRSALQKQPYFLALDTTRKQLTAFGALYGKGTMPFGLLERQRHHHRCQQYREAAALFAWSHWCADSIIHDYGVDANRVHIIPPGVDLDYWHCERRIHEGPVNLLFVGSDFRRKGGEMLLQWARTTQARDWRLHLVTRDAVVSPDPRIQIYNDVLPNSSALQQLYRQADLFVLPTQGDCYSIAAIEAMASGLPVILARTGGTGDIVQEGVTGYLMEVADQAMLTARLEYLLSHPEARLLLGAAARRDAEARYDVRANIHKTVQIMREHIFAGRL